VCEDVVVVIDGERIADICRADALTKVEFPIHRCAGMTLLPGLIDSHVHITMSPHIHDWIEDANFTPDAKRLLRAAENAREAIACGVTTVRDLGGKRDLVFAVKDAIDDGTILGPHLIVAGSPLTCPQGHCYHMGGEVANRDQICRLIGEQVDRGAEVVKVMASGGGLTPGTGMTIAAFERDDLALIVDESRRHNKPVSAHVGPTPVIRQLCELGVDTLEHCLFLTTRGIVMDDEVMRQVKQADSFVIPTRYQFYCNRNNTELRGGLKVEIDTTFARLYEASIEFLESCRALGVRVAAGSDAGIPAAMFDSIIGELEVMVIAGYSPVEAVQSATRLGAEALRVGHQRGVLAKGLCADMLLVAGPVHEDISNLRKTRGVFLDGRLVVDNLQQMNLVDGVPRR